MINNIQLKNLLYLSPNKKQLLLLIQAMQDDITIQILTTLFNECEFANFKLDTVAIIKAVKVFTHLQIKSKPEEPIVIAERLNAQLTIQIDAPSMQAKAKVTSAYGGQPLSIEQFYNEINALHIKQGIIKENISLLIKQENQAVPGDILTAVIAQGIPAIDGIDCIFKRLVESPSERLKRPKKNKDGSVDMRDLGPLITVKPGTKLMRKILAIPGKNGINVTGGTVIHKICKDMTLVIGENTYLDPNDKNLLIAGLVGVPKLLKNGMSIDDVLIINSVDVGYGHVNFAGSVIIEGNICDGMKVKASGDITVSGFVESAQIECGGDLIVGKGIIGHKIETEEQNYSCNIKSKGSVTAHFSQYVKIVSGAQVNIKTQLLNCDVTCQGNINVLDESTNKGTIFGGSLTSRASIKTASLGANSGVTTKIDLSAHYPQLKKNNKKINRSIEDEESNLEGLIQAQYKVDIMPDSDKKQILIERLSETRIQVEEQLSKLNNELDNNNNQIKSYFKYAKVSVKKEMFHDVFIAIGKEKFISKRTYGPIKIRVIKNIIIAQPYY